MNDMNECYYVPIRFVVKTRGDEQNLKLHMEQEQDIEF